MVTDPALIGSMARAAKAHALAELGGTPEMAGLRGRLANPAFDIFYGAPAIVIIWTIASDDMGLWDCCLAGKNLMLAATVKGLGSCWIGFAEGWLATAEAKRQLGIDAGGCPVAPTILGRPLHPTPAPTRAPPRVHWIR